MTLVIPGVLCTVWALLNFVALARRALRRPGRAPGEMLSGSVDCAHFAAVVAQQKDKNALTGDQELRRAVFGRGGGLIASVLQTLAPLRP